MHVGPSPSVHIAPCRVWIHSLSVPMVLGTYPGLHVYVTTVPTGDCEVRTLSGLIMPLSIGGSVGQTENITAVQQRAEYSLQ